MSRPDYSPTPVVMAINDIALHGNITPLTWFHHLTMDDGKPNLPAITVLADIVYWYRPQELRDEKTGNFIGWKSKFKGDMLQMGYEQFADRFGLTKRQVKDAVNFLIKEEVLRREFRTIQSAAGLLLGNVMFVEPIPEGIKRINQPLEKIPIIDKTPNDVITPDGRFIDQPNDVITPEPLTIKRQTLTENTKQEITTKINLTSMHANGENAETSKPQPTQTGMDAWMDELNDPKFNFLWDIGLRNEKTIRDLIVLPMETLEHEWAIVKNSTVEPKAKAGTLSRNLRIALTRFQIEQRQAAERAANPAAATPAPSNAHPDATRYQRPDFITEAEWYGLRDVPEVYELLDGATFDDLAGTVNCRTLRLDNDLFMKRNGASVIQRFAHVRNWQPQEDWA